MTRRVVLFKAGWIALKFKEGASILEIARRLHSNTGDVQDALRKFMKDGRLVRMHDEQGT